MSSFIKSFLVIIILSIQAVNAQDNDRRSQLDAVKSAFITRRISLSPEESRNFWPVYDQYENELKGLRKKHREELLDARLDFDKLSDKEIEKIVDGEIVQKQSEIDLQKKYLSKFKQVLPIRKIALLFKAEEDFKKELLKRIREGKN